MNDSTVTVTPAMSTFIEGIAQYYENFGIPRIAGRLYGLLLTTSTPLSADQIANLLDASLSSVSTNIRVLIANGWAEKVTAPGERTTYYRFAPKAWENVMERRRQAIVPLQRLAEDMLANLGAEDPAQQQLADMVQWADLLMEHYQKTIVAWKAREAQGQHG